MSDDKRLDQDHIDHVCKPGKGAISCAFLMMGSGGMECAKNTAFEEAIRSRLAEGTMEAASENCNGLPEFNENACELGRTFCQNAAPIKGMNTCVMCFQADMANCKYDPNPHPEDCRQRCARPEGACAEGQTYYEQLGLSF